MDTPRLAVVNTGSLTSLVPRGRVGGRGYAQIQKPAVVADFFMRGRIGGMKTNSRQFSVRSLLLATAVVAIGLGVYCYFTSGPPPLTHGDFIDTNTEFTH